MTTETNCPNCAGSITVEFGWQDSDSSVGFRGGVELQGVTPNDDCECPAPKYNLYHDKVLIEHAEEAAADHLASYERDHEY